MKRFVLLVCLANISLGLQAGELYRWVDPSGNVHYSDEVPSGATQVETKKLSDAAAPNENLPYETRLARQNFPVTLYVADNCGEQCDQARDLLDKRGIPFSEKSLRTKAELEEFEKLTGFDSVPTLSVGRNILKGFQADQWHDELNIAGYPKTAPYRAPATPAAADQGVPASSATQYHLEAQ